MEEIMLDEVTLGEEKVGDVLFETRTAGIKGFVAGALTVGAAWFGTSMYKKFKNRKQKSEETDENDEELEEQGA